MPVTPPVIGADIRQWGRELNLFLSRNLGKLFFKQSGDVPSENGIFLWDEQRNYPVVSAQNVFKQVAMKQTTPSSSVGAAGANFTHYSSSIAYQWQEALNNQSATAIVGGITNTIAPGGIFLATTASNGATLAIQRDYTSGVNFLSSSYATTTGSISRDYAGNDTWYGNQGVQLFNGRLQPYSNYPRKSS